MELEKLNDLKNILDPKTPFKEIRKIELTNKEEVEFQCENYNSRVGTKHLIDGIECDICKNRGLVGKVFYDPEEDWYDFAPVLCSCFKRRKLVQLAKDNGFEKQLHLRLKDYKTPNEWQKKCHSKVYKYCTEENESNKWFVALGQSGSGKTTLACIVANNLFNNHKKEVYYIIWTDFIARLKRDLMDDLSDYVSEYLDEIKNCEVLFLDEIIKKYNETDLKYLIEIINYRYQKDLRTIITSEHTLDELLNIDEATFGRAIEKAQNYVIDIERDRKKNWRLQSVDE